MEENEDKTAHVAKVVQQATEAQLMGADWAAGHGLAWLVEAYNGIGPEFLGDDLRAKSTEWFRIFEPAALIHDARNHVSDGSRVLFDFANFEFRANCLILADRTYPWWNWRRYRARLIADALYDFVASPAGWKAWLEAHDRHIEKQNKENNQ